MKYSRPRKPIKDEKDSGEFNWNSRKVNLMTPAFLFGFGSLAVGLSALLLALSAFVFKSSFSENSLQTVVRLPYLLGAVSIVGGIATLLLTRRNGLKVGRKLAIVGGGASVVAFAMSSVFLFASSYRAGAKEQAIISEEATAKFVGFWQNEINVTTTVEFTPGGAVIVTKRYEDRDDPEKLRPSVEYGRFKFEKGLIHMREDDDWHSRTGRWDSSHTYEFISEDRLLFGPTNHSIFFNFQGKWKRISEEQTQSLLKADWTNSSN